MNEWLSPSSVTAMTAIIISVANLGYTRKVEKRQAKLDQPTVSIDLRAAEWPGWYRMTVTVRNRTDAVWILESMNVPHWDAARFELESRLPVAALGATGPRREHAQFDPVIVDERIEPAGANGPGALTAHLLISVERGLQSHSMALAVSLRCLADMRRMDIHVRRTAID